MLIDFHVHLFPDAIAEKALSHLADVCKSQYYTKGTYSDTLRNLKGWNVDVGVVMSIATNPHQQKKVNDFAASIQGEHLLCFGSVHPDAPDALDELERIKALGLHGVKLHPDYQDFMIDDKKMYSIYDAISALGLPVTFHTGRDPLSPSLVHASPQAVAKVVDLFPHMKLIAAHMGGMAMYEESLGCLCGKNLFLDTAMCFKLCPPAIFERMVRKHGAEHILFASDCPWSRSCDEFSYIEQTHLSSREKDLLYFENAQQLLGIF